MLKLKTVATVERERERERVTFLKTNNKACKTSLFSGVSNKIKNKVTINKDSSEIHISLCEF